MKDRDVVNKFISLLSHFSVKELVELRRLFQHTYATKAFLKILDGAIELRSFHPINGSLVHAATPRNETDWNDAKKSEIPKSNAKNIFRKINGFSHRFADILQNKKLYRSTKDVVNAVNSAFNWEIKYEDFYKRGRRDLINHCINRLGDIEEGQRRKMIKSFLDGIRARKNWEDLDRHYRELFNILAGDE